MSTAYALRPATPADAAAVLSIYAPFVEHTAVSFETAVPTVEEMADRIATTRASWQWLVAERDGACAGYAYGGSHRARHAYRYSTEVSAYIAPGHHRQGLGRALYERLFEDLAALGYCSAYAGIVLPNEASVALHRRVGFAPIGVFPRVGYKLQRWHDVAWFYRPLREEPLA